MTKPSLPSLPQVPSVPARLRLSALPLHVRPSAPHPDIPPVYGTQVMCA